MPASIGELKDMSACYIHPFGSRVLILPRETPKELSGLIVPDAAREKYPTEGEVIECGPDVPCFMRKNEQGIEIEVPVLQPGDRVVYSKYTGFQLNFGDGKQFILVPYEDIAGMLDPACPVLGKEEKPSFTPR